MIQINSLSDEWSVDSWTAENRHGTCCVQLDDFDWVIPAEDLKIAQARGGRGIVRH